MGSLHCLASRGAFGELAPPAALRPLLAALDSYVDLRPLSIDEARQLAAAPADTSLLGVPAAEAGAVCACALRGLEASGAMRLRAVVEQTAAGVQNRHWHQRRPALIDGGPFGGRLVSLRRAVAIPAEARVTESARSARRIRRLLTVALRA